MSPHCCAFLPRGSIRLLRVLPQRDGVARIECRLHVYDLLDSGRVHPFDALSYVWGSQDRPRSIIVDDCEFAVGDNLHAALLHIRDRFLERIIWIDAICINQSDSVEKSHQVQSTAMIYAKANRVVIWLGESAHDSDGALTEILGAAEEQSTKSSLEKRSIGVLLQRPWFQRIWVLQELAAARHVLIKCGNTEVDGYAFCLGLDALKQPIGSSPGQQAPIRTVTHLIRGSIFRPRDVTCQSDRFSLSLRPLIELLELRHNQKATMRHDRIYALLGICSDPDFARLSVNYIMPWKQLFRKLIKFIVSDDFAVDTWDEHEIAAMKGKGCVLGDVLSVERDAVSGDCETLVIRWVPDTLGFRGKRESCWSIQAMAEPVEAGDVVCSIHGAMRPMIVRPFDSHWTVIRIGVSSTRDLHLSSGYTELRDHANRDFLLVWDRNTHSEKPEEGKDYESYITNRHDPYPCPKIEPENGLDSVVRV
ncbi:hypothetical protein XA68_14718 [Ophiocordyceps unilateralis]|uniref:Heterokaryon incompatibility domain-containing protein n=1 Tax=Ophiocordyceps unilateralis TaxID=268505 RepID=A0A2A9PMQ3_OPHUN|nr:hypothetical protein XA68_14718 [Ophiocordyceps unilateralis]